MSKISITVLPLITIVFGAWNMPNIQARYDYPDPDRAIADFIRQDPKESLWFVNRESERITMANRKIIPNTECNINPYTLWADRLLLVVFVVLIRLPGFDPSVVEDWDEGYYTLGARELLNGELPYVSIFVEKPLGAFIFFATAFQVFGQSIWTIRLVGTLCVAATTLMLRELAVAGGVSRIAATGAALFYASNSIELGGMASNIEILLAPFTVGAIWLGLRFRDTSRFMTQSLIIASAGLLIGIGIWFKYVPAFPGCALFALLVAN